MATQQTTATDLNNVIAQLVTFAVANAGFTAGGTYTNGTDTVYRLTKGSITWHLWSQTGANNIHMRMSYSSAATMPTQANGQRYDTVMTAQAFAGPYSALYLFTDGTEINLVLELTNGVFNHLTIGSMVKTDTFNGGEVCVAGYYTGTNWNGVQQVYYDWQSYGANMPSFLGSDNAGYESNPDSYIRHCVGAGDGTWHDFAAQSGASAANETGAQAYKGSTGNAVACLNNRLLRDSPNTGTQRVVMLDQYLLLREPTTGLYRVMGYMANQRNLTMRTLDVGEVIYTDWQVFPVAQRNGNGVSTCNTGENAIAYHR